MKIETIDFKEVKYQDLHGLELPIPDVWIEGFGNSIYIGGDIPASELGSKIFHSKENDQIVKLNKDELSLFILILDSRPMLGAPAHRALKAYLTEKLES